MDQTTPKIDDFYQHCESWVVMAIGVFISAARSKNFSVTELARQPVVVTGNIEGGIGQVAFQGWFPFQETVCRTDDDAVYCKMADLPLPREVKTIDPKNSRLVIDFRAIGNQSRPTTFSLTYFPWFRFLAEPINFDAVGRVAAYVSDSFAFLFKKCDLVVTRSASGDSCTLQTDMGIAIDVIGMNALSEISIRQGDNVTRFDFDKKSILISEAMFPSAYLAADQILATGDSLANVSIEQKNRHVMLQYATGV